MTDYAAKKVKESVAFIRVLTSAVELRAVRCNISAVDSFFALVGWLISIETHSELRSMY